VQTIASHLVQAVLQSTADREAFCMALVKIRFMALGMSLPHVKTVHPFETGWAQYQSSTTLPKRLSIFTGSPVFV
jgi:hypothetical protein